MNNKGSNIFFDLDGTLIDSKLRLYELFVHLTNAAITFDEYWVIKRQQKSNSYILENKLSYNAIDIKQFEEQWMQKIESWEYLQHDKPFNFTASELERLSENNKLHIVTARQSKKNTIQQLQQWGWYKLISKTLITEGKIEKYDLIRTAEINLNATDLFIGDTGKDIQAGQRLNIKTIAVLSGFRNKEALIKYNPDFILENFSDYNCKA